MDAAELARRIAQSRLYTRFCCHLFKQQVSSGKRAVFEHPQGSKLWSYPGVKAPVQEHELVLCHMCKYGLRLPGASKYLKKATHLLISHDDMKPLAKQRHRAFDQAATEFRWTRSAFDPCLYFLRGLTAGGCHGCSCGRHSTRRLGGSGSSFEQAVSRLKSRFHHRKESPIRRVLWSLLCTRPQD